MYSKLQRIWKLHGFEIAFCTTVVIILFLSLFRIGKTGTYSDTYNYVPKPKRGKTTRYPDKEQYPDTANQKKDSRGETECRRVLQQLFNKPFYKARPDFLRNPVTGGHFNLELDCFESELRLAVEYNGCQHYKYVPFFHRNKEHFMNQKYRDDMKRRICTENGIVLIEVPYTTKIDDIRTFLIHELNKNGYW
jgi:hypothetical protein